MPRPSAATIVLGVLCLGALSVATNIATSALPPAWSPYLWLAWPAMPVLLGAAAVIEVQRSMGDNGDGGGDSPRARVVLLDRVHRYWVRGVLEQSLYQEARIELGMTVTVDAPHPWDVVVASPDGSSRAVPAGTTMAEEHQQECVTAINDFRTQGGATRIVVCCRTTDYERLRDPLRTYGTLAIQPLTGKQVEDFLARAGEPVAAVRAAIAADSLLGELIQSPLLLNIAVLAYRDAAIGTVATGDDSQQLRSRLFATYVRTMLTRRRSDRQTVRRLAFLAKCMKSDSQTVFTLELLHKYVVPSLYYNGNYSTVRWSRICGLAGGLVLCAAGLVAYGWRGGLASAVIGAAVGLPHFTRIDTFDVRYNRRTLNQERTARNPDDRIDLIRGWVFSCLFGVERLGSNPGGEVPSPIARAVMRRGLLAVPLVSLATPILPGLLVAWLVSSAGGIRFAAVVAVGAAMPTLVWFGGFAVVEQAMVRREFRRLDLAPLPLRPFLDYATQCLFLRQVGDGYLFVHLSLLEFFAEMWDFDDVPAERLDALAPP